MIDLAEKLKEKGIIVNSINIRACSKSFPERIIITKKLENLNLDALGKILREIYVEAGLKIHDKINFPGQFMTNLKQNPAYSIVYSMAVDEKTYKITEKVHFLNPTKKNS